MYLATATMRPLRLTMLAGLSGGRSRCTGVRVAAHFMLGSGNGAQVGGTAAACLTFSSVLKRINALVVVQVEVSAERRWQADNWLLRCCHQGSASSVSSLHHQPQCQPAHGPMAMRRVRKVACAVQASHSSCVAIPDRVCARTSLQAKSAQPCLPTAAPGGPKAAAPAAMASSCRSSCGPILSMCL